MFNPTSVLASLGVLSSGDSSHTTLHPTVQQIDTHLLRDDNVQIISSLQLNQIASYTFHESSIANGQDLSEQILEMIQRILSKPFDHSVVTLQKTLVVLRHILIFGAEKNINACLPLGRLIQESLLNYNTALIAQQQQSVTGMLLRIQGGTVDKGGPVRDVAQQVYSLLTNRQQLVWERAHQQDPNSLVPVGNKDTCAFVTDEVRYAALQQRMERERRVEIKSNLAAKQDSAFGGGYNARDGKNVVGAAHGIEEMMKMAQRETMKFSDDGKQQPAAAMSAASDFAEYMAPTPADLLSNHHHSGNPYHVQQQQHHHPPVVMDDFLSLSPTATSTATTATATEDLLGFGGGGGGSGYPSTAASVAADLLGTSTVAAVDLYGASSHDPYSTAAATTISSTPGLLDIAAISPTTTSVMKSKNIMSPSSFSMNNNNSSSSGHDAFAALDALGSSSGSSAMKMSSGGMGGGLTMGGLSSLSFNSSSIGATTAASASMAQPLSSSSLSMNNSSRNNGTNPLTDLSSLSLLSITTPSTAMPVIVAPTVSATSMRVSQTIPGVSGDDDDDGGGFVMGGSIGSGLMPEGPAPAAPPPPPPPPAGSSLW